MEGNAALVDDDAIRDVGSVVVVISDALNGYLATGAIVVHDHRNIASHARVDLLSQPCA